MIVKAKMSFVIANGLTCAWQAWVHAVNCTGLVRVTGWETYQLERSG